MTRLCCLLLIAFAAPAQVIPGDTEHEPEEPPQTGKGVIQGSVVDAVTHEPVKKAQVVLSGLQSQPTATTDLGGNFVFRDLPAGTFWLHASKAGYDVATSRFGAEPNLPITLEAEEVHKGVEIKLMPGGSISGHVVNEDGLPVRHCTVTAVQPGFEQGHRFVQGVFSGMPTNDRGEYRITNLASGHYFVFARCQSVLPAAHPLIPRGDPRTPHETYMPLFYGGGLDPTMATKLNLPAGGNLDGIDLEAKRVPAFTLRGVITSADPGAAGSNFTVLLRPANRLIQNLLQYSVVVDERERTFQINAVVPGSYNLIAFSDQFHHPAFAQRAIEIANAPPEPVELALTSGADLRGMLTFDSNDRPPLENARISLTSVDQPFSMPQPTAEIAADGSFTLTGVMPGRWRAIVGPFGYVKTLLLGGQQVSPFNFQVTPGMTGPLQIVLGTKMGTLEIEVTGMAVGVQAYALLFPEDPDRLSSGLERMAGGAGRLMMGGLAPGRYRLLVTDLQNPWPILQRPDLLKAIEGSTQGVDIPEGGRVSVSADLVPRDDLNRILGEKQ